MTSNIENINIDYWRQLDIFSPSNFKKPITVIGAGATGSYVVWILAKMGCRDITVYDFDTIENYNPPNQMYGPLHVGRKKVDALAEIVMSGTGIAITPVPERFANGSLNGIVFVLTDTMASRKEIWENSIRYNLSVDLLIETRMAAEGGMVYAVEPLIPRQIAGYEKTLYKDSEADEPPCSRRAIAPTVAAIAGIAVSRMISFAQGKPFKNELVFSLWPSYCIEKNF